MRSFVSTLYSEISIEHEPLEIFGARFPATEVPVLHVGDTSCFDYG